MVLRFIMILKTKIVYMGTSQNFVKGYKGKIARRFGGRSYGRGEGLRQKRGGAKALGSGKVGRVEWREDPRQRRRS